MADVGYFQHQLGAATWLTIKYWVEGSEEERMHNVLMVGSANYFGFPADIEALVLSETGALITISQYAKHNLDATMYKVVGATQPKVRER